MCKALKFKPQYHQKKKEKGGKENKIEVAEPITKNQNWHFIMITGLIQQNL
jgi:hypothetical protein